MSEPQPSTLRRVLIEDLLANPLRCRSLATANPQVAGSSAALNLDPPFARARVGGDGHHRAHHAQLAQRRLRDSFHIGLIHPTPVR